MTGKLEEDAALKASLELVLAEPATTPAHQDWYARLDAFIAEMRAATRTQLHDPVFLKRLWNDNPVAAVGNGTVNVAAAWSDRKFVDWFAEQLLIAMPTNVVDAEMQLTVVYDEAMLRLNRICGRRPVLKLNRVLCSFFPQFLTTIADVGALRTLYKQMGERGHAHPVRMHIFVRQRIDAILGDTPMGDVGATVRRICLPWLLFERLAKNDPVEVPPPKASMEAELTPQPASLRRKGITAMKGGFQTLLSFLPALDESVTREEFMDLIRQANPDLAPGSLGTVVNVVAHEFNLCSRDGGIYELSARGNRLLESQDPDELADHLLTRILGVDHVLEALATTPRTKGQLVSLLQKVNPGWTSDFAPSSLLGWMVSLGLLTQGPAKQLQLSERGRRWGALVTWEPEFLEAAAATVEALEKTVEEATLLPAWPMLRQRLEALVHGKLSFSPSLVEQLHAGLWFHPIRHFAALSGLSGSGKTQLALNYALALCGGAQDNQANVRVIPVQPGWFDPSPLLGYVNPLQDASYRGAPFLELLLKAADDPTQPYVVILDEMNLSHPEQYLAPILSAMETHGWIDLHQLAEGTTETPRRVQYPANLAIIGTLNMDETTHGLSDKVLDRAYTLEFWDIEVSESPRWKTVDIAPELRKRTLAVLEGLAKALSPIRLHFGWRTIDDVLSYLQFTATMDVSGTTALDDAIYAKVLPKLRGETSQRFSEALQATFDVLNAHDLGRCRERVRILQNSLKESGTALFWR